MNNIALRLYFFFISAAMWLQSFAQEEDDDDELMELGRRKSIEDLENIDELSEYLRFTIRLTDVIIVIIIVLACYVFGRIWKGCSYLILIVSALFYYLAL